VLGWDITSHVYSFAFIAAFVAGIIFNVMPCVLPVVPLKAIGFYEVSQHHRGKSLALGLVFSAGLVSAFGVLAVLVVGLRVLDWGELFTKPWFIIPLVVILIVMGFSLFGAFTVLVPTALYRITPRHDTYSGNFLFGILTAALSPPCTFGLFVVVLAWALKQPPAWGVALVMTVGAGMAFPYLVLSALPELARQLPRTGPWSEMVKQLMGFLLIATAIYFARPLLDRALPPQSFWWAIFACVAGACLFLVVRTYQLKVGAMPRAIAVVVALLIIVPALYATRLLTIRPYQWTPYSDAALTTARSTGRPVLVEFTADWCGNCHYLEAFVLHKPRIVQAVNDHGVVMLKADVTAEHAPGKALLAKLSTAGAIPLTAIYPPGATQPILLTGIYSQSDLRNAIEQAVQTPVSTGGVVAAGPHR
jgi:thiol:disulfide interchange protein DsbD